MPAPTTIPTDRRVTAALATVGWGTLRLTWHALRLPVLALLVVMEPFVRVILTSIAALGVFTALFFEFLVRLPHFPFGLMMGLSAGFALLLVPYYGAIRLFSFNPPASP